MPEAPQSSRLRRSSRTATASNSAGNSEEPMDDGSLNIQEAARQIVQDLVADYLWDIVVGVHNSYKSKQIAINKTAMVEENVPNEITSSIVSNPIAISSLANSLHECYECRRKFPAQRYAQHLEKCLGVRTLRKRGTGI